MKSLEIIGFKRANLGKKDAVANRLEGNIPCVVYGKGEQVHFYAPAIQFRPLLYSPNVYMVELNIEGQIIKAIIQDSQYHPVSDALLHADFLAVDDTKPVKMEIPVEITGSSIGIQKGGKLSLKLRTLKIKAFPKDMPDSIPVDISSLDLGKSVKVGEVQLGEGLEVLNSPNVSIASIEIPRALRGKQAAE
ncbi:50S ribosomal protein L25/general stress protein Ctc [Penaeicola halotolerans]|uniref:50S ribosomal protein L25/general stress protein Ctc n=1 Tax=Penaeicola halotolerans TaxID=2793196 RepID=UPI001CF8E1B3|nr:50S ribosomal protein L25/general stress protein Ctc [Penaeicola halotolerans]